MARWTDKMKTIAPHYIWVFSVGPHISQISLTIPATRQQEMDNSCDKPPTLLFTDNNDNNKNDSNSIFCFYFLWLISIILPSVLWCWRASGQSSLQKFEWWCAGMLICMEQGANDLHIVQLMTLPPHHLLLHWNPVFWVYPGCPGKRGR